MTGDAPPRLVNQWQRQCLVAETDAPPGEIEVRTALPPPPSLCPNMGDAFFSHSPRPLPPQVWSGPLAGSAQVVVLFNRGSSLSSISAPWALLGLTSGRAYTVRDLWAHSSSTLVAGKDAAIRTLVPSHGVAMYRVSPADSPRIAGPSAMGGPAAVEEKRGVTRLRAPSALQTPMRA